MAESLVETPPEWRRILRTRVDATSYRHATDLILRLAAAGQARYVCVATVNNLIEGCDDPGCNTTTEAADLVTPDGMPWSGACGCSGCPTLPKSMGPT